MQPTPFTLQQSSLPWALISASSEAFTWSLRCERHAAAVQTCRWCLCCDCFSRSCSAISRSSSSVMFLHPPFHALADVLGRDLAGDFSVEDDGRSESAGTYATSGEQRE